ncbi:YhcH/YjgK/YiaL family protein [Telmatospirillum siberiense]|uniref:YhcH/YjgK/YiaL family protein n=1 Tax=Telmatospirillum siberiense TaxID=382514 RepID=A0A2N3PZ01_9PROT|nr:YhcH/YjgK/YiaL family protein [Telmatospirillum siberiense]PKU25633.1 YhcH/YjgK/YiaL family protein [Telmatospirillum siberiense]
MLFGNVHHAGDMLAWLPAPLQTAIEHLRTTDFKALPAGNYDLQGKDIYVQVIDLTTKALSETRPEVHRKYIDVQFLVSGAERIGFADDTGRNVVAEDLLAERDLLFYQGAENESMLEMVPGSFAVFLPSDVHRPACQLDAPRAIRKVVVKVRFDLLKKGDAK